MPNALVAAGKEARQKEARQKEAGQKAVKLADAAELLRPASPPAPYGVRRLARCYSIEDLARLARRRLPAPVRAYLDGGGEGEVTLERNRSAFRRIQLAPRVLRDVSSVDTSTTVLGARVPVPLVLSPVGAPRFIHHEGERAVARAAGRHGIPYALSTLSTTSIEDAATESDGPLWFQLYLFGDRGANRDALARAKAAGFGAALLSVDVAVRSRRERELRAGLNLPDPHLRWRTFVEGALHPNWCWNFLTSPAPDFPNLGARGTGGGQSRRRVEEMFDGTVTWDDLGWVRQAWDGPLALKGIIRVEDARRAADEGIDAVVVSNHGGRQLDQVPATIEALPAVVDAVGDRLEVLVDSGVRRGGDVLAALALGARAVLVGRAYLYGLAAAGQAGVAHAIDILSNQLRTAMALCGCTSLAEIDRSLIW
jgi:L-lactate dehydrogenase (cytochrome)